MSHSSYRSSRFSGRSNRQGRLNRPPRHRALKVELLEDRRVLAHADLAGLGIIGDSLSDEYTLQPFDPAQSWPQVLVNQLHFDTGPIFGWPEPRRTGYEFNWARFGADAGAVLAEGQLAGLLAQVNAGVVSHVVITMGQDNFLPGGIAHTNIYGGFWTKAQADEHVASIAANIETVLQALEPTSALVVLANVADWGIAPGIVQNFPDPVRRSNITSAISTLNGKIATLAADYEIPHVDLFGLGRFLFGTNSTPKASFLLGGIPIARVAGTQATNAFVSDGIHPNTVVSAIIGNLFVHAMNEGFLEGLDTFTEAELLAVVGLPYGGLDTLNLPYTDLITAPEFVPPPPPPPPPPSFFVQLLFDANPVDTFDARLADLAFALGIDPFTTDESQVLRTAIKDELAQAFADFDVGFVEAPFTAPPGERLVLGNAPFQVGAPPFFVGGRIDYQDRNPNSVGYLFPAEFQQLGSFVLPLPRDEQVAYLGRAMGFFAVDAVAVGFGTQLYDAYGDPRITVLNYFDTRGFQNRHYQSGDFRTGFDFGVFASDTHFTFSAQQIAKLQFVDRLVPNELLTQVEDSLPGAQPIILQPVPVTGMSVGNVLGTKTNPFFEIDVYSFVAQAGNLVTVNAITQPPPGPGPGPFINPRFIVRDPNDMTLFVEEDVFIGPNRLGPFAPPPPLSPDALVVNFIAPLDGTYKVSVDLQGFFVVGNYDLFVAVTETPSLWHNLVSPFDVNGDDAVNALDLLLIVNELTTPTFHDPVTGALFPTPPGGPPLFFDAAGDGTLNLLDLLAVVDFITTTFQVPSGGGAGEGESQSVDAGEGESAPDPAAIDMYFAGMFTIGKRKRR